MTVVGKFPLFCGTSWFKMANVIAQDFVSCIQFDILPGLVGKRHHPVLLVFLGLHHLIHQEDVYSSFAQRFPSASCFQLSRRALKSRQTLYRYMRSKFVFFVLEPQILSTGHITSTPETTTFLCQLPPFFHLFPFILLQKHSLFHFLHFALQCREHGKDQNWSLPKINPNLTIFLLK